jgi:hypothetical protein
MALVSINELPENILLELFTHVPARQLLLCCRPVCSLWRDLIDVATLWKRKSLHEGFITKDWDQPVADWKIFYFLCSLRRNLLRNPCAEGGLRMRRGCYLMQVPSLPKPQGLSTCWNVLLSLTPTMLPWFHLILQIPFRDLP